MRQRAFRIAADDICQALNTSLAASISPQLGVTRTTLQGLAKLSYGSSSKLLLSKLLSDPDQIATLPLITDVKMSISKYCHAIKYGNTGERENEETLVLRRRLHLLIMYILKKLLASKECKILEGEDNGTDEEGLAAALFQRVRELEMEASGTTAEDFLPPLKEENSLMRKTDCLTKPIGFQYSDIPELLKLSCEASYEYFQALASIDHRKTLPPLFHNALFDEEPTIKHLNPMYLVDRENLFNNIFNVLELRLSIAMYIQNQLRRLMEVVSKSQENLVYDMQACLLTDVGVIKLEQGWVDDGIDAFHEAIRLFSILRNGASTSSSSSSSLLSSDGDKRAEFNAYSLLGSAYCIKHEQREGMNHIELAINMEMEHVGSNHQNLATKFVNAALCAFEGFIDLTKDMEGGNAGSNGNLLKDQRYFLYQSHKYIMRAVDIITVNEMSEVVNELKVMAQQHLQKVVNELQLLREKEAVIGNKN